MPRNPKTPPPSQPATLTILQSSAENLSGCLGGIAATIQEIRRTGQPRPRYTSVEEELGVTFAQLVRVRRELERTEELFRTLVPAPAPDKKSANGANGREFGNGNPRITRKHTD